LAKDTGVEPTLLLSLSQLLCHHGIIVVVKKWWQAPKSFLRASLRLPQNGNLGNFRLIGVLPSDPARTNFFNKNYKLKPLGSKLLPSMHPHLHTKDNRGT